MPINIQFMKQKVMRIVGYTLLPAAIASIYFFGWRSLVIIALSVFSCLITEWLFVRGGTGKVSEAAFVTAFLYALSLPPTLPLYMVIIGAVFGITFGKMAFGGFSNNVFNPAMVGRAFVYITFPIQMTNRWIPAANFSDFPGGFVAWQFHASPDYLSAITEATPQIAFRDGATSLPGYFQLLFGNINGQYERLGETTLIGAGSLGEVSAILLLIGGVYLVYKKIANWKLVTSFFVTYIVFDTILHLIVPTKVPDPLFGLLAGTIMLGGFYIVTDPVSATKTDPGRYIYGSLIAIFTLIIKSFSLFSGGLSFGILLGNMFGPIIDHSVKSYQKRRKAL
ncbi:MAG: RnfABCDGE type electron transport complex subunit D [bacterium]|nr:MAG: RnfABCDGE type electron transport complex subunit D [bacterium]